MTAAAGVRMRRNPRDPRVLAYRKNQAEMDRRAMRAALSGAVEDEPHCSACEGEGVDGMGFDCRECFGTGEPQ